MKEPAAAKQQSRQPQVNHPRPSLFVILNSDLCLFIIFLLVDGNLGVLEEGGTQTRLEKGSRARVMGGTCDV